ncbi:hypothetical protein ACCO45_011471 [Purpureocillium lilacinum]|uniref:Uncharacterized protein n=1 Tax=Purpureocillium lilacinum TaxID=33203 RepID=A0ACC4DAX6_PURLI
MIRTGTPVHSRSASPAVMGVPLSRKPLPRNPPARPPPPPSISLMERRIGTDLSRPSLEPLVEREANRFITEPRIPQIGDATGPSRQASPLAHKASGSPKDQIRAQAIVLAEVRTNVMMTSNKRNVALLQAHLFQALRVPPKRGFVRFAPVTDDCSGWGGKTVAGQIAEAMGTAVKGPGREQGNEAGRGGFKVQCSPTPAG